MKQDRTDPLIESLMGLAVAAAPLIRRARESGIFRAEPAASTQTVDASVVREPEPAAARPAPETAALEALIGRQAMRIAELEAEVAALRSALETRPAAKKPSPRKAPARKAR